MISIEKLYDIFLQSRGISIDTRSISANCFFFCLSGERFDGNTFAKEALDKGAKYVVIDNPKYKINNACIYVNNTLKTLQQLAHFHRNKLKIPVIGITGTNGKTTTKELIHAVLSAKYKVCATQGNLNNHIGVPLTLLAIDPKNTQIAVVEMGANHIGEIKELCQIADPNHGIITNIGKAHLEGFGSIEGIIETKSALYQHITEKRGLLFVHSEDKRLMQLSKGIKKIIYGKTGNYKGFCFGDGLLLKLHLPDYDVDIQTQLIGEYNFSNVMAAVAVGSHFAVSKENIKLALEGYVPNNNRSQVIKNDDKTIIIDAYNANPSSMKLAIENMAGMNVENKILLLGDMAELGEESVKEHQQIVDIICTSSFDYVYLLGNEFAQTNAPASWLYQDYEHLKNVLEKSLPSKATILLKGSRSMGMERFLEVIRN